MDQAILGGNLFLAFWAGDICICVNDFAIYFRSYQPAVTEVRPTSVYFPQPPWEWKPGAHCQEGDGILSLRGPSVSPSGSCRAKGNAAEVNYQPPPPSLEGALCVLLKPWTVFLSHPWWNPGPLTRTNALICRAQCRKAGPFFKNYEECQDGDSRGWNQAQGQSFQALDPIDHTSTMLARPLMNSSTPIP